MMTDYKEKYEKLIKGLKEVAEQKSCYNKNPKYNPAECKSNDDAFDDGAEWGEILICRTMLECIGEEFECPYFEENA